MHDIVARGRITSRAVRWSRLMICRMNFLFRFRERALAESHVEQLVIFRVGHRRRAVACDAAFFKSAALSHCAAR